MISFNDVYRIVPEGSDTTEGRRFLASKRTEDYILVDQRYGQYVTFLWIRLHFLIFLRAILCVQFFIFIFFSFLHSSPHTTFYFLCLFKCGCRLSFLQVALFFSFFNFIIFFYPTALEPSLYLSCFILSNLVLSDYFIFPSLLCFLISFNIVHLKSFLVSFVFYISFLFFNHSRRQQRAFTFESSSRWINRLSDDVISLGSQLHGVDGDFVFPLGSRLSFFLTCSLSPVFPSLSHLLSFCFSISLIISLSHYLSLSFSLSLLNSLTHLFFFFPFFYSVFLLEEVEEIASVLSTGGSQGALSRGWTVELMSRIGLTYGTILEFFLEFMDRWSSKSLQSRVHLISSASFCLTAWKSVSMRFVSFFFNENLVIFFIFLPVILAVADKFL